MTSKLILPRRSFVIASGLTALACGAEGPKPNEPGAPAPSWQLQDFQPTSERFEQVYGLEHFRGSVLIVALYSGWCNTCEGAAIMLSEIVTQMQAEGFNLRAAAINEANALHDQQGLIDTWDFTLFQDTEAVNAFRQHGGTKDDMFVYTPGGVLSAFLQWGGKLEVYPSTATGRQNIRNAILDAQS